MAAPPTLADTLRPSDSRRGGHASAAHCVHDGMSHLCFQWRPDPSKSACGPRSVFLITLPTPQGRALVGAHPVSGTVGRGHGACATSWASPISACRNGGGPRHRPSPRSAPQAPLASAPPPGGGSHRDFHIPHANYGMATAAGCWHMLPAPRGAVRFYASGEFSVVAAGRAGAG